MKVVSREITDAAAIEKANRIKPNPSASFQEVLQSAQGLSSSTSAGEIKFPPVIEIPIIPVEANQEMANRQVVVQIENLLSLLEDYQQKMEDSAISLKEVYPLIERLESENKKLRPILETLPDGTLKEILNSAMVTSSVEVIKYNRGDYL
jgi:hypothetical protein